MSADSILEKVAESKELLEKLAERTNEIGDLTQEMIQKAAVGGADPFIFGLTVFLLACFVGYYVVWRVTPALHSPLMAVTNAISSVIIVGALIAAGPAVSSISTVFGFFAVLLAAINIFGGFVVTDRMLHMFSKKK